MGKRSQKSKPGTQTNYVYTFNILIIGRDVKALRPRFTFSVAKVHENCQKKKVG
jgi:hypothetical protein